MRCKACNKNMSDTEMRIDEELCLTCLAWVEWPKESLDQLIDKKKKKQ